MEVGPVADTALGSQARRESEKGEERASAMEVADQSQDTLRPHRGRADWRSVGLGLGGPRPAGDVGRMILDSAQG